MFFQRHIYCKQCVAWYLQVLTMQNQNAILTLEWSLTSSLTTVAMMKLCQFSCRIYFIPLTRNLMMTKPCLVQKKFCAYGLSWWKIRDVGVDKFFFSFYFYTTTFHVSSNIMHIKQGGHYMENLEKSGNWKVVREKSGKMNYYNYSVAASIVQSIRDIQ